MIDSSGIFFFLFKKFLFINVNLTNLKKLLNINIKGSMNEKNG